MPVPSADFSWTAWHGHPSVITGLVVLTGAYLLGVGRCGGALVWPST